MSYILDALRKSDRERAGERATPPAAGAAPGFRSAATAPRRPRIAVIAVGLALLAGIGTGLWIGQQSPAAVPQVSAVTPPKAPDAGESLSPDTVPQTASAVPPLPAVASSALEEDSTQAAPERPGGILELWQLTDAEQHYLQALDVTLHVHSSDPAQRAVIINGLRAREGQELGEALRLAEIVPDGLILEFQGQLVHLPNPQPY